MASAASEVAARCYEDRVADPGLGIEFATLADSYNSLAQRLGKVEAIRRRMLADLAHGMRTPLATVEAHLEPVEDGVRSLDADTRTVIRMSTRRLGRLAEDIAAVSQAEEGTLDIHQQAVETSALVSAASEGAQDRFTAKGVRLDTHLNFRDSVLADPDRIGQILSHLIDNALRHTPAGASVTLSCRRADRWVEFVITDSGEGIAPEHLGHVFDRFYRVDTARDRYRGGTGLSPGPGRGGTFTVRMAPPTCSQRAFDPTLGAALQRIFTRSPPDTQTRHVRLPTRVRTFRRAPDMSPGFTAPATDPTTHQETPL